jgi:branched-subunit amino acid ABC-type transport system permease component
MIVGSAIAAISGILLGLDTNITPTMGFNILVQGIVAMIVGGTGNGKGLAIASLLLACAQNSVAYFWDAKWMDAVAYCVLILFLTLKPSGVTGRQLRSVGV